jgi:transposase
MKAYSEDLRERVIGAVETDRPREEVAARFEVSVLTIERWVRLQRETGGLARRRMPGWVAV